MLYRYVGYKLKIDNNGAVTGYILFLLREGADIDNEYGEICDIVKLSPSQFNPGEFSLGSDVGVTYDRLGNVRSIVKA